jgi:hypothetical protein
VSDPLRYKVVETSLVTDESIESILNEWVAQGWTFDSLQFVTRESSRRPAMAFVLFVRASPPPLGT